MEAPETRYARSGDYSIAYQVVGQGDLDLVYVPGLASHLEVFWEEPAYSRFLHRLASFRRLILMDRLGTGLSDRLPAGQAATFELRMDDIRAVMDAVGAQEFAEEWLANVPTAWGQDEELLRLWAPSVADLPEPRRWFARFGRLAASPGSATALFRMVHDLDIRGVLPAIRVPMLLIHRVDDTLIRVEHSRYMAERIPDAKLVEMPARTTCGGSAIRMRSSTRCRSSSRARGRPPSPIASSRRSCSPTSSPPPSAQPSSATDAGASCSQATRRSCGASWDATTGVR